MATIDTIADRSTGSAIAGKAYFETSTNKFIVFNGSAWIELDSDGTGLFLFNDTLTFPIIQAFDNESDFITDTGADDYTIVHAKDTDRLYVWDGSAWYLYNNNSTV